MLWTGLRTFEVMKMVKAFDLNENVKMVCYDNGNVTFVRYNDRDCKVFMLEPNEVEIMKNILKE